MGPRGAGPRAELLQFRREVEAVKFVVHKLPDVPREVVVPVTEGEEGEVLMEGEKDGRMRGGKEGGG